MIGKAGADPELELGVEAAAVHMVLASEVVGQVLIELQSTSVWPVAQVLPPEMMSDSAQQDEAIMPPEAVFPVTVAQHFPAVADAVPAPPKRIMARKAIEKKRFIVD